MYTRKQYGAELIAVERQRQIDEEGWTREHDAAHGDRSLVRAAMLYALASSGLPGTITLRFHHWQVQFNLDRWLHERVGWRHGWFRPEEDDPVRNLQKAGALIAAEIDRLVGR